MKESDKAAKADSVASMRPASRVTGRFAATGAGPELVVWVCGAVSSPDAAAPPPWGAGKAGQFFACTGELRLGRKAFLDKIKRVREMAPGEIAKAGGRRGQ